MLIIDKEKCIGCRQCESTCPFGAISMESDLPAVSDSCVLCGNCERDCPVSAISITSNVTVSEDFHEYSNIWVVMEVNPVHNHLQKVSLELLSEARRLADKLGQKTAAVLLCDKIPDKFQQQVLSVGCDIIYVAEQDVFAYYDTIIYAKAVVELVKKYKPASVLFPASENGRDLAPRVSCSLQVGLTADCTGFDIDEDNNLVQIRPTYGGNIMASIISPNHRPQLASARSNVFCVADAAQEGEPQFIREKIKFSEDDRVVQLLKVVEKDSVFKDVAESDIVIVAGMGVGSKENYKKIEKLAAKMGAAIGATRKVVDEGWAPPEVQVGQTGKTIAPDLYIACGVSGALQHSIGMKNAKYKIAINTDAAAPIFKMCDVSILGDCVRVAEELYEKVIK